MTVKLLTEEDFEERKKLTEQWFEVKLLSKGKHGYPEKLVCRPLKVKDLKPLIVTRIEDEVGYLKMLVAKISDTVVEPKGFDLREVTIFDFFKVLLAHRVNSIGSFYDLRWVCDRCGKEGGQTFDLMQLEEKYISDEYPGDPVVLESGVKVRFPRVSALTRKGSGSLLDLTDMDLAEDAVVDGGFDELDLRRLKEVMDFIRKWYGSYGLQDRVRVKCKECGGEQEVVIPYLFFLFFW